MTPELWQRLKLLYEDALETPADRRSEFLDEACGNDSELRGELEALLEATAEGTDTLDVPLIDLRALEAGESEILARGAVVLGRFHILRHLGSGGMGDVYEASDADLGSRRVALKTIRPAIAKDPTALARFREEVFVARKVSGPHVCRIHELFVPPAESGANCAAFLTMELLEGTTLSDRLSNRNALPPKEALEIALQLCAALQCIHDAGIVHRDLKPRNIMLVPSEGGEKVVVMDFGLARVLARESRGGETSLTSTGAVMGTPDYMAPEQFAGREVSPATDIFALGLILYGLVTGKRPSAIRGLRRGASPVLTPSLRKEIPPIWGDVIARCLEYDAGQRFQSASEVADALHSRQLVLWRSRQGRRITLTRNFGVAACALLLVVLATGGWFWSRPRAYQPPSQEVARWYERGMTALREDSYLEATRALGKATEADKNFALAHAGLAEAWEELDFTGTAEREMLIASAPEQQRDLPDLDRKYIDAIRTTLIRDYSSALQDYEVILQELPQDRKAQGYVDLGRVYEKAGRFDETIASYEKAAQLSPDDPAPFLHLGILKSRRRDVAGAKLAFDNAEALYVASSNFEGIAEVDYERGYAANVAGLSEQAKEYLNKSLAIARQIPSVQLEIRSLTQLSSVDYNDSRDDQAIAEADQAIKLAEDNGLEYWSTDGLVRLANVYIDKEDFEKAEALAQQALRLATQNQHPRLEASSRLTLASIRDQKGRWNEAIAFAQPALKYYEDYRFMDAAASAATIIVRSDLGKGNFLQAQQEATELVQDAARAPSQLSSEGAEDTAGNVSSQLEQYPVALTHYENALKIGQSLHVDEAYNELHCADTLSHLGRFAEADAMLATVAPDARKRTDIGSSTARIRADMQLVRNQYREALATSRAALAMFPGDSEGRIFNLEREETLAEANLGQTDQAQHGADAMMVLARKNSDDSMIAEAERVGAEVALRSHSPASAAPLAEAARQYFAAKGEKQSEWMSLLDEAEAMNASGNVQGGSEKAAQAIDIMKEIEQSWDASTFHIYSTRPDYQLALHKLAKLRLT